MSSNRGRPVGSQAFRRRIKELQAEEDPEEAEAVQVVALDKRERAANARQARVERQSSSLAVVGDVMPSSSSGSSLPVLQIGSSLQQTLAEFARKCAGRAQSEKSEDKNILQGLFSRKRTASRVTSEAEHLNTKREYLRFMMHTAAAFLVLFSGYLMGVLLSQILFMVNVLQTHEAVLLLIRRKYDETPSKISVSKKEDGRSETAPDGKAKVLQSRVDVCMLLKDKTSEKYLQIHYAYPTWLQCVDKTTAETTVAAQAKILSSMASLDEVSKIFKFRVNHTVTDKAASNMKAEAALSLHVLQGTSSHVTCDIHKIATITGRALKFVDNHVSALIAGALAMADAGSLLHLRKALAAVLESKLQVKFGRAPQDDHTINCRNAMLDAFLPQPAAGADVKKRALQRRFIISFFLNGDIQDYLPCIVQDVFNTKLHCKQPER